jgi:hypothetical protein
MTRARALKIAIRSRAARTGERYTTARRHVLHARATARPAAQRETAASPREPLKLAPPPAIPAFATRGTVSDARCREKTGHGLDYWFGVLDRFGAVEKGHTASARHLHDGHGVEGWHSQAITVAYERARGVRSVNQRCDGAYEVSVSKVMPAVPSDVIAAFGKRRRKRWSDGADRALVHALAAALGARSSKGFVLRDDGLARYRYRWDDSTVQMYLVPRPGGKTAFTVQHTKLAGPEMVEARRGQWRTALQVIAAELTD